MNKMVTFKPLVQLSIYLIFQELSYKITYNEY